MKNKLCMKGINYTWFKLEEKPLAVLKRIKILSMLQEINSSWVLDEENNNFIL